MHNVQYKFFVFYILVSTVISITTFSIYEWEDANNSRATWIFAGTGEGNESGDYGIDMVHGGAAGFEIDRYNSDNGVPRHVLHFATSELLKLIVESTILGNIPLEVKYYPNEEEPRTDIVFFETPNGAAMFSTGSITWIDSTLENNDNTDIAKITGKVIQHFPQPRTVSSHSHWEILEC